MRMGKDHADQLLAPLGDEARVREDGVDAGDGLVAEGDAAIHDQPLAVAAVEIEVHPDLAGPTQRDEPQAFVEA